MSDTDSPVPSGGYTAYGTEQCFREESSDASVSKRCLKIKWCLGTDRRPALLF